MWPKRSARQPNEQTLIQWHGCVIQKASNLPQVLAIIQKSSTGDAGRSPL